MNYKKNIKNDLRKLVITFKILKLSRGSSLYNLNMKKYTFPKSTFACHRCRKHTDDVIIKSGTQLCGDCFEKKCDICGKEDN